MKKTKNFNTINVNNSIKLKNLNIEILSEFDSKVKNYHHMIVKMNDIIVELVFDEYNNIIDLIK